VLLINFKVYFPVLSENFTFLPKSMQIDVKSLFLYCSVRSGTIKQVDTERHFKTAQTTRASEVAVKSTPDRFWGPLMGVNVCSIAVSGYNTD
jgi:hypothetical protein